MKMLIEKAKILDVGVWRGQIDTDIITPLSKKAQTLGKYTVIMLSNPDFRRQENELRFSGNEADILNLGTTKEAIFIEGEPTHRPSPVAKEINIAVHKANNLIGVGDHFFHKALREVSLDVKEAGEVILAEIRKKFPGDLKAYKQRRFFDSPDNFWGVQVQTRLDMLKFWVRGTEENFLPAKLEIKLDRPPLYFAFKVKSMNDVPEAITIISMAQRKFH